MAKQKTIRFKSATMGDAKLHLLPGDTVIQVPFHVPFTQLEATALDVRDRCLDKNGAILEDFKGATFSWEYLGALVTLINKQRNLFSDKPVDCRSLIVDSFSIKKYENGQKLQMHFSATFRDENAEFYNFVRAVRKNEIDIDIVPANKTEQSAAEAEAIQIGLYGKSKTDDPGGEEDEAADDSGEAEEAKPSRKRGDYKS